LHDGSIPNPELTDHGEKQCAHVLKNFPYKDKITHVFASPTHRTLQTAYECFKPLFNERALQMHIWDPLVELGDQPSNMSDPLPELKIRMDRMGYPVDLSGLKQGYEMNTKSSLYRAQRVELVKTRLYDFCMDPEVSGGEELEILIVSHGSFLRHLLGGDQKHRFHNTRIRSCQFASEAQIKNGAKPYDIFETEENKDRPELVLFENAPPGFQDFWDERRLVIHQWERMISKEYDSMIPCPTMPSLLEMFPPPQVIWECLNFSPHFTLDQLRCEYKYHLLDCSTYPGSNKVPVKMESTTETAETSQAGDTQTIIEDPLQSLIKKLHAKESNKDRVEEWVEKIEEEKRRRGWERLDDNKILELAKSLRLPVIQSGADTTGKLTNGEGSSTEDGVADAAVESCPGYTDATKDEKQDVQECLALPREDPSLSPIRDIEDRLADEEKPPKRQCKARTL
jgi:broad specificity phosphatase PhoE